MTLIEQLQNGKVAVKHDGTFKDLETVLNIAFPQSNGPNGVRKYYRACMPGWTGYDHYSSLPTISVSEFIKEIENQKTNNMKTITHQQAQDIIDSACVTWKEKLYQQWGKDIVFKKDIQIDNAYYTEMRNACTKDQHILFDEIFGSDKPQYKVGDHIIVLKGKPGWNGEEGKLYKVTHVDGYVLEYKDGSGIDISMVQVRLATPEEIKKSMPEFKVGDWVIVIRGASTDSEEQNGKCLQIKSINQTGFILEGANHGGIHNGHICPIECRHATPEEIKKATTIPEGTPCFVRDMSNYAWYLYYADGNGKFYHDGKKSGNTITFNYVHKYSNGLPEE
jgi:hypothetical protein